MLARLLRLSLILMAIFLGLDRPSWGRQLENGTVNPDPGSVPLSGQSSASQENERALSLSEKAAGGGFSYGRSLSPSSGEKDFSLGFKNVNSWKSPLLFDFPGDDLNSLDGGDRRFLLFPKKGFEAQQQKVPLAQKSSDSTFKIVPILSIGQDKLESNPSPSSPEKLDVLEIFKSLKFLLELKLKF